MTKADLVSKLAEDVKVTKKTAAAMMNSLIASVKEGLKKERKVRLEGLGTFVVADRKARAGINPRTKAKIKIPATKAPRFRAAQALKDSVKYVRGRIFCTQRRNSTENALVEGLFDY